MVARRLGAQYDTNIHGREDRIIGTGSRHYLHDVDRLHGDVLKALSPFDFAIGWDRAAQAEAIARVRVLHGIRQATFHGLRPDEMTYVTNMHLIPGSPGIFEAMSTARKGDRVALMGYAVTVRSSRTIRPWRSDMIYGDLNCEIVVVTGIRIEKQSRTVSAQL